MPWSGEDAKHLRAVAVLVFLPTASNSRIRHEHAGSKEVDVFLLLDILKISEQPVLTWHRGPLNDSTLDP